MISFNEIDCNLINLNRIGGKVSRKPDPISVRSILTALLAVKDIHISKDLVDYCLESQLDFTKDKNIELLREIEDELREYQ